MKKALVIGGGFGGCAAAHQLELLGGWQTTLVETAAFLGGGCKTFYQGGHPYTFGPRHFLTNMIHVYEYLNTYVPLRRCNEHLFWTYVEQDQRFYHYPIHIDDIRSMPDAAKVLAEMDAAPGPSGAANLKDYWINSVGPTLYAKFIHDYNNKMWKVSDPSAIDHNVQNWSPKGPNIASGPREVFHDWISCYPHAANGYDDFFKIATAGPDTKVLLKTRIEKYDIPNKTVVLNGEKITFDIIVSTASLDVLFNNVHGELRFIGRDFYPIVLPIEEVFPKNVFFCYYANAQPVTRVVEYKKLTLHKSPTTLIGIEIPSMRNRLYPVPISSEVEKAKKYLAMIPDGVFSIGRMGKYDYVLDIDDVLDDAIQMAKALR
ncbi:MAG TPA: UDP-galactopyranose mutase [Stellaceae bacterium]|nr:UDP-galactopyranose mutase [Stellaceae bacterium]